MNNHFLQVTALNKLSFLSHTLRCNPVLEVSNFNLQWFNKTSATTLNKLKYPIPSHVSASWIKVYALLNDQDLQVW